MASLYVGIASPVLTFILLVTGLSAVPRELKCGENDPRQTYPNCMFGSSSKTLWCDQSRYEKIPSVGKINSHLFDVDCRTAKALFVNDSCLKSIDRNDMGPYKKIQIFLGGQNFIPMIENSTFHENKLLKEIDLSDNDISALEKKSLRGLRELRKLYLNSNRISHIDHHVLKDLGKLEEFSMENNFLKSVDHGTFRRQHVLRKLNLKGNSISRIDDFAFENNPELRQLHLDGNEIEIITVNTFAGLHQLEILTVSHNRIKIWPEQHEGLLINIHTLHLGSNQLVQFTPSHLANMSNLQNLMLDNNSLSFIREDLLRSTPRLVHLNLSANRLEDIPDGAFNGLCHLESLILTKNKLRTPREGWFVHLVNKTSETTHTAISENQWSCDCHLRRFKKFHDALKLQTDAASRALFKKLKITCQSPKFAKSLMLDSNLTAEIEFRLRCPSETGVAEPDKAALKVCDHTLSFNREYFDVASQYVPHERRQVRITGSTSSVSESKASEEATAQGSLSGAVIVVVVGILVTLIALMFYRRWCRPRKR